MGDTEIANLQEMLNSTRRHYFQQNNIKPFYLSYSMAIRNLRMFTKLHTRPLFKIATFFWGNELLQPISQRFPDRECEMTTDPEP